MSIYSLTAFSPANRRLIFLLVLSHIIWSLLVVSFWAFGQLSDAPSRFLVLGYLLVQLYFAAQLILPAVLMQPEERTRGFYLIWGGLLLATVWLMNRPAPETEAGKVLLAALNSGLLLLIATFVGGALAKYVRRLWEVVPVCIVMTLADVLSWFAGPTDHFSHKIREYYLAPVGPPPAIDMLLVKLAVPSTGGLVPVFGVSDWIMTVFFSLVAARYGINDNLCGPSGAVLARKGALGRFLPVAVTALGGAIAAAQLTGLFIPALPVVAIVMLSWYAFRSFGRMLRT